MELISVTGERGHLSGFALDTTGLMAIRPGAFDDLPNVNNCKIFLPTARRLQVFRHRCFLHEDRGFFRRIQRVYIAY